MRIPENVEFFLNIEYIFEEKRIKQIFMFIAEKKYFKYVYDDRYNLKENIDKVIAKESLNLSAGVSFKYRFDEETYIAVIYDRLNDEIAPDALSSTLRNVSFYLPPNNCMFCEAKREERSQIFCLKKGKHYTEPVENCKLFKSLREIIT